MPIEKEIALRRAGKKQHFSGRDLDNFVYGTMVNQGWKPINPGGHKKKKGK